MKTITVLLLLLTTTTTFCQTSDVLRITVTDKNGKLKTHSYTINEFIPDERPCETIQEAVSILAYDTLVNYGTIWAMVGAADESDKRTKRLEFATCLLSAAILKNPNDANTYSWRGLTRSFLGEVELALIDFTKASKIDPSNPKHFEEKGNCKMKLKDYYGAIDDFSKAINKSSSKEHASSHSLFYNLSWCYFALNKVDVALENINRAIALNSDVPDYYLMRGGIRIEQNRIKEGCLDFSKAGEMGMGKAFTLINEYCK